MLEGLISSQTRIKLLLKFFLNIDNRGYLRSLEEELGENVNSIRKELNRLETAGLLATEAKGNKKLYRANNKHPLFKDLNSIVRKFVGIDQLIERVTNRLGNVKRVYLEGQIAKGIDCDIIDVILVGEKIDKIYLQELIEKAEPLVKKRIRYLVFENDASADLYAEKNKDKWVMVFEAS
ncbi:MAG: ArsR family transcriptional regulator [Chitinophagaceae bacterium]|nr:MAG: ArsR family transcriptional regulator [Chitinophagaceae bacterium]